MRNTLLTVIATAVIVGIGMLVITNDSSIGGLVSNSPTYTSANTSTGIEVGPQENVRVVATTSARSYLLLQHSGYSIDPIFCEADSDKAATALQGIQLGALAIAGSGTTTTAYEFSGDKGNLYVGSIRCTATASTTLLITEFKD